MLRTLAKALALALILAGTAPAAFADHHPLGSGGAVGAYAPMAVVVVIVLVAVVALSRRKPKPKGRHKRRHH